jgi:aspartyl-tRNA(Asn)/glutamyl-tRNA(Gln) amidotransferase subunit C
VNLPLDELRALSRLAGLQLDDQQLLGYQADLQGILALAARLAELPLAGVEPCPYPRPLTLTLQPDRPGPGLPREVVLRLAPAVAGERVRVPRVVDGEG